jgi:hypothetical protein
MFRPFLPKGVSWAAFIRWPPAEVINHYKSETRRNRRLKAMTDELLANLNHSALTAARLSREAEDNGTV